MDDRPNAEQAAADRAAILNAPVTMTRTPGGLWRAAKAGLMGIGTSPEAATRDLGEKVWITTSRIGEPPL